MNVSQFKPVMKLLIVVMASELLIMTGLQFLPGSMSPELVNMLDVLLLGLITTAVAQLWVVRPLAQAREQDALFRSIAENSHAGLVITDPAQGNAIIYVNDAFSQITGYALAEVKGKHPNFLSDGLAKQPDQGKISEAIKAEKPVHALLKNRRKDGAVFWNDLHLSPIRINGGAPQYWLGMLHDVSETKALNLQVENLVSAVEQAGEMICIFDQQGTIDFVNRSFTQYFGVQREQENGASVWQYWCDESWTQQAVEQALEQHGQWSGRNQWRGAEQKPFDAMTNISLVKGDSEKLMFIAVIRDMTEEIELGNKLAHAQKMEAVGTLAGGIAHDFNNMLAAMMGNLYLLKKNMDAGGAAIRRVESIEEQGYRGAELIRQMLVFSRKQAVQLHDFDLRLLAKESIKLLLTSTPENIRLNTDLDATRMMIHGDPSLLESSLLNLVNNARHAIEDAGVCDGVINLTMHAVPMASLDTEVRQALTGSASTDLQQCVHISVSDNGSGMDKKTQKHVFEPYFTTKKPGQGTGLGLAMVMGCVEMHGGWIGLTSALGKGTSFDIYLPMGNILEQQEGARETEIHPGHGELILLADDNVSLCESVGDILESAGYKVLKSFDGEQALQCYLEHKADVRLAILDCVMPKMGGAQVAEAIWQQAGDAVKTVLMTGYDMDDSLPQEWVCGDKPLLLQKPWQMEQLNDVLKEMHEYLQDLGNNS